MRPHADEEEPDRQAPEPESHPLRTHLDDQGDHVSIVSIHEVSRDDALGVCGHVDDSGDRETGGANADEHARTEGFAGEFLRHQPVDEGAVDHEADEEADTLDCEAADDDGEGACGGEVGGEDPGVRTDDEERVGGEDPDGRHARDGEVLGRPSDRMLVVARKGEEYGDRVHVQQEIYRDR